MSGTKARLLRFPERRHSWHHLNGRLATEQRATQVYNDLQRYVQGPTLQWALALSFSTVPSAAQRRTVPSAEAVTNEAAVLPSGAFCAKVRWSGVICSKNCLKDKRLDQAPPRELRPQEGG